MKRSPLHVLPARANSAFTLLEIMLVVLIIGLLIGMAVKFTAGNLDKAKEVAARGKIETYKTSLLLYESYAGRPPTTEQGLKALTTRPESEPRPKRWSQCLDELPLDPWEQDFHYEYPGKHNPKSFDLYSAGADGIPGNADDIGNWSDKQP